MNILYILALSGGIPGLVLGFVIGKSLGKKVLGMELGMITGMWVCSFFALVSVPLEMSFYSLGGVLMGLAGCFIGKKIGRFAGKIIFQKINS